MKILLLKNNIYDQDTLNQGLVLVQQYALTIGLELKFDTKDTTKQFTSFPFSNATNPNGYGVNSTEIFQEAMKLDSTFYTKYALACLVYDWTKIIPQPTNPMNSGMIMQIPQQWYVTYPEVFAEFFLHELCHFYFQKTGKMDITHSYDANFTQKPRKDWYLFLLKGMIETPVFTPLPVGTYKYFKPSEIVGLKPELVKMLDKAREKAGIPFKITSGFRTPEENASVGGVEGSEHTLGSGCDILANTSEKRFKIVSGALQAGFTRIGFYLNHVHLGIGELPIFPQNVFWVFNKD